MFDPDYDPLEARRRKEGEEGEVGEKGEEENGVKAKKRKVDGEVEEDKKESRFETVCFTWCYMLPHLPSRHPASPHLTSPHLTSPHLTSPPPGS